MMRKIILYLIFGMLCSNLLGQDVRVAQYYFRNAEYEKSAALYKQLYEKNKSNTNLFSEYVESLINIPNLEAAKKVLDEEVDQFPNKPLVYLLLAKIAQQEGDLDSSEKHLQLAVKNISNNPAWINQLAQDFANMIRYDLAIETMLEAERKFGMESLFDFQLANYYHLNGDMENMQNRFLSIVDKNPNQVNFVKQNFIKALSDEDYTALIRKIIQRLQKDPNSEAYNDLMTWAHLQKNDYMSALRHNIALDKRTNGSGMNVLEIGQQAANADNFEVANTAYNYILENKNSTSPFYDMANIGLLKILKEKIDQTEGRDTALISLAVDNYSKYFESARINPMNIMEILKWAELLAFYQDQDEKAIEVLQQYIEAPGINPIAVGNMKLLLGDIYLMNENRWDATLLYSQVDKEFKEGFLGEKARFKNANLSYYFGDFSWAQSQYKILKTTTSKLIANDAIDKSVFITDNLGLDSNTVAMTAFAAAEFLVFKKKYDEANKALIELLNTLHEHNLVDDIYFTLGEVAVKKKDYDQAIHYFNKIIDEHSDEIKMDNALFALAEMYELHLNNTNEAMKYYEDIFTNHSASTFAVEARKRFRLLRGDEIQ